MKKHNAEYLLYTLHTLAYMYMCVDDETNERCHHHRVASRRKVKSILRCDDSRRCVFSS